MWVGGLVVWWVTVLEMIKGHLVGLYLVWPKHLTTVKEITVFTVHIIHEDHENNMGNYTSWIPLSLLHLQNESSK